MKQRHVVPAPKGGWDIEKAHARRISAHEETKSEAIERAREICKKEKAELFIHNKDGQISQRNSYGNDPFPPKG